MRQCGYRVFNFPRPGSDEVQAIAAEKEQVTLTRAARRAAAAHGAGDTPPMQRFPATADAERGAASEHAAPRTAQRAADAAAHARRRNAPRAAGGGAGAAGAATAAARAKRARTTAAPVTHAPGGAGAPPALPPVSPAAGGAGGVQGADARHHDDDDVDVLLSFLRGITPPLRNLPAVLDAARRSGVTLPHLARLAAQTSAKQTMGVELSMTLNGLAIRNLGDQMSFTMALAQLHEEGRA
jgi:hypothetical protein